MFRKLPVYLLLNGLIKSQCSWHIKASFLFILIVTINLVSIFFSESATLRAMRAFHLSSNNYGWWALEQISPRMYAFSNHSEIITENEETSKHQINHYPIRVITFIHREKNLKDKTNYQISSEYRGIRVETSFKLEKRTNKFSLLNLKQHEYHGDRKK